MFWFYPIAQYRLWPWDAWLSRTALIALRPLAILTLLTWQQRGSTISWQHCWHVRLGWKTYSLKLILFDSLHMYIKQVSKCHEYSFTVAWSIAKTNIYSSPARGRWSCFHLVYLCVFCHDLSRRFSYERLMPPTKYFEDIQLGMSNYASYVSCTHDVTRS